jgi:hypothetical protein
VLVEVLDECVNHLVGYKWLAGAIGGGLVPVDGEDAAQFIICVCYRAHRPGEYFAEVDGSGLHVAPARAVGNLETVLAALAEDCLLLFAEGAALLALQLGDGVVGLALPLVAQSLVEHQRQDVVLIVLPRCPAAQDVCCAPEVRFELLESELHLASWRRAPEVRLVADVGRTTVAARRAGGQESFFLLLTGHGYGTTPSAAGRDRVRINESLPHRLVSRLVPTKHFAQLGVAGAAAELAEGREKPGLLLLGGHYLPRRVLCATLRRVDSGPLSASNSSMAITTGRLCLAAATGSVRARSISRPKP